jgi:hypothetical protein
MHQDMPPMCALIHGIDMEYFQEHIVGEYVDCHSAYTLLVNSGHSLTGTAEKTYVGPDDQSFARDVRNALESLVLEMGRSSSEPMTQRCREVMGLRRRSLQRLDYGRAFEHGY